jgi:pimeloyl-ACP methyl ester carboxylesterase
LVRTIDAASSPGLQTGFTEAADGTRLCFYDARPASPTPRVPLLCANGLGGPIQALAGQMLRFSARRTVMSWDYRGLYGSSFDAPPRDMSVRAHAKDAVAVLDALDEPRVAFFGWSMGAQVGLELARLAKGRVRALVLLNGSTGKPLEKLLGQRLASLTPNVVSLLARYSRYGQKTINWAVRFPFTEQLIRASGLIGSHFSAEDFARLLPEFGRINFTRYLELLKGVAEHDAEPLLQELDVPTLILGSSADHITEAHAARRLARRIPGAEYREISWASHYAALEAPEQVFDAVEEFLARRVDFEPRATEPA